MRVQEQQQQHKGVLICVLKFPLFHVACIFNRVGLFIFEFTTCFNNDYYIMLMLSVLKDSGENRWSVEQ